MEVTNPCPLHTFSSLSFSISVWLFYLRNDHGGGDETAQPRKRTAMASSPEVTIHKTVSLCLPRSPGFYVATPTTYFNGQFIRTTAAKLFSA